MEEYDEDYESSCPKCAHSPIRYRECSEINCNDGYIDLSDLDPINYMEGEDEIKCSECHGTGIEEWCPECGYNISDHKYVMELNDEYESLNNE